MTIKNLKPSTKLLWTVTLSTMVCAGCVSRRYGGKSEEKIDAREVNQSEHEVTLKTQRITAGIDASFNPDVSPNGKFIFFTSNRFGNNEIMEKSLTSSRTVRKTSHQASDFSPQVSPNGKYLAFVSRRDDALGDIYIMPTQSKWFEPLGINDDGVFRIRMSESEESFASWFPDSGNILISTRKPGETKGRLIKVNVWDGKADQNFSLMGENGTVSPSGKLISFIQAGQIYVYDLASQKIIYANTEKKFVHNTPRFNHAETTLFFVRYESDTNHDGLVDHRDAGGAWMVDFHAKAPKEMKLSDATMDINGIALSEMNFFFTQRMPTGSIDIFRTPLPNLEMISTIKLQTTTNQPSAILPQLKDAKQLELRGDDAEALKIYQDALARRPRNFSAQLGYVSLLAKNKDGYAKFLRQTEEALNKEPNDAFLLFTLGVLTHSGMKQEDSLGEKIKRLETSIVFVESARNREVNIATIHQEIGRYYEELGILEESLLEKDGLAHTTSRRWNLFVNYFTEEPPNYRELSLESLLSGYLLMSVDEQSLAVELQESLARVFFSLKIYQKSLFFHAKRIRVSDLYPFASSEQRLQFLQSASRAGFYSEDLIVAENIQKEILKTKEMGGNFFELAQSVDYLAMIQRDRRDYVAAERSYHYLTLLLDDLDMHENLVLARLNLASVLIEQKDFVRAKAELTLAEQMLKTNKGSVDKLTIKSDEADDSDEPIEIALSASKSAAEGFDTTHRMILLYSLKVRCAEESKDLKNAIIAQNRKIYFLQLKTSAESNFTGQSEDLANAYSKLGALQLQLGRFSKAIVAYQKSREILKSLRPPNNENTYTPGELAAAQSYLGVFEYLDEFGILGKSDRKNILKEISPIIESEGLDDDKKKTFTSIYARFTREGALPQLQTLELDENWPKLRMAALADAKLGQSIFSELNYWREALDSFFLDTTAYSAINANLQIVHLDRAFENWIGNEIDQEQLSSDNRKRVICFISTRSNLFWQGTTGECSEGAKFFTQYLLHFVGRDTYHVVSFDKNEAHFTKNVKSADLIQYLKNTKFADVSFSGQISKTQFMKDFGFLIAKSEKTPPSARIKLNRFLPDQSFSPGERQIALSNLQLEQDKVYPIEDFSLAVYYASRWGQSSD